MEKIMIHLQPRDDKLACIAYARVTQLLAQLNECA